MNTKCSYNVLRVGNIYRTTSQLVTTDLRYDYDCEVAQPMHAFSPFPLRLTLCRQLLSGLGKGKMADVYISMAILCM